jgi:predicted anti-sigma-YlaC factor YlaD
MPCIELDDVIEPIAAGDVVPTPSMQKHLAECSECREALALATEVHRLLAIPGTSEPRADFVAVTMARMRRERWRSEQYLDVAFNTVVALAILTGLGGLYAIMTATGVAAVSADVGRLFVGALSDVIVRAAPQAGIYALATMALLTVLFVWWWAEHGFEL